MTRLNEKVDTTEGKWREAVRICERILSERATFDYEETNYKLEISKKVQTLFKALQVLVWGADQKNTALWLRGLRDRLLPLDPQ